MILKLFFFNIANEYSLYSSACIPTIFRVTLYSRKTIKKIKKKKNYKFKREKKRNCNHCRKKKLPRKSWRDRRAPPRAACCRWRPPPWRTGSTPAPTGSCRTAPSASAARGGAGSRASRGTLWAPRAQTRSTPRTWSTLEWWRGRFVLIFCYFGGFFSWNFAIRDS